MYLARSSSSSSFSTTLITEWDDICDVESTSVDGGVDKVNGDGSRFGGANGGLLLARDVGSS